MRVGGFILPPTRTSYFGHANIIKYCNRPFLVDADRRALQDNGGSWHSGDWKGRGSASWKITTEAVQMMDDMLINNINSRVGKDDVLWHLGDFSMFHPKDKGYYHRCRAYRDRINCDRINIVWGNHDDEVIRDLFDKARELPHIEVNGQMIALCHYFLGIFNKNHRGAWCLYGHSHSQAEKWINTNMPGHRAVDVGVDNAAKLLGSYRPFSIEDIRKIMAPRNGFSMDHHIPRNSNTPEETNSSL